MKRKKPKTREYCMLHFSKRLRERFNLDVDPKVFNDMINRGQSEPVFRESNSRVHHKVKVKDQEMVVVYNTLLHTVVTVIPKK